MKKLLLFFLLLSGYGVFGQALTENFEGAAFPPTGWTFFETGTGLPTGPSWAETNLTTLTYQATGKSAYMNRENVTSGLAIDWLVTRQVTVPANGQLRFYTKTVQVGFQGTLYDIKISSASQTNPADFTTIQSWDDFTLTTTNNVYEEKVIDIPAAYPAGSQIYIAFVMSGDFGDRWLVDEVNVVEKCKTPIGPLSTSNESTTSAQLSWGTPAGAGITQWEVQVVEAALPFTDGSVLTQTANTNVNYLFTGLQANKLYKFQVRSVCTSGFESDWFGPRNFETSSYGDTCGGPIVIGSLPYQTTDNTANYLDTNDINPGTACTTQSSNYMEGNDVFYSFTPNFTGNININLSPTATFSSVYISSACPVTAGTCLGGRGNSNANPRILGPIAVTSGTTYYITVSSYVGASPLSTNQTVGYTLTIQQVFCNQPTALTATGITSTSANLSWAAAAGTTQWQYSVGAAPYGLPTGTGFPIATTNTGTPVTGIPGITYQYYVRADCNDGNYSIWSGPFSYTLPQVATPLNFTDGFETLTGWTLNNATQPNKWAVGTGINNGGTHALYITDTNGATNTYNNVVTSVSHAYKDFVIPAGATQLDFTFDWRSLGEAADYLRVWTVPAATVITAGTAITSSVNKIQVGGNLTSMPNFTTQNYTVNAAPYAGGNMRLVFEWINDPTNGNQPPAAIDNIKLDLVTCPKPMNPTITNINYNNAQLNWANGATETEWEVLVLPAGSPAPTATSVGMPAFTNPFVIPGLDSVTCYDVYVRAKCGLTEVSFWSVVTSFCTTPHYCAGDHFYDTGGVTGNYTNNQNVTTTICPDNAGNVVTVIFNDFDLAAGDQLIIRNGNLPTSPILGTYTGSTLPPSFTATTASGCLTFVFTSDGFTTNTGWDATIYCTPPITCPKPITLTVTNITTTSAQLGWTETGTATQWEVLALPMGSAVPAPGTPGIFAGTNPFVLSPLTPGTAYTFFVRAICSPTDASFWSNGTTFSTKPINDECAAAINVLVNNDIDCALVTAGTITGATNSGAPTSTCGGTTNNDTWFSFTASSTAQIINFNNIVGNTTDLSHAVYSGSCGALTLLYCETNNFSYNNTFVANQTYYIRVWSETTGPNQVASFNLCVNKVLPPIFAENSSTIAVPTTYTVEQLVTDVLVTSPCGIVSNITSSTGTNFGDVNGIGYFSKNGSSFGLNEGIILATRSADTCDGPNINNFSQGGFGWPGDAQLLAYMQSTGQTGTYNNSSVLEFDFVPIADQIKFDFIFASDEYGTYQCTFSDAFAFFLTDLGTGVTTNLAVIPGTSPAVPVAVTTIRKAEFNSGCSSENPTYFDKFYGDGFPQDGLPDVIAPTDFKGYTVPMSATGTVIPGQTYHMKFVVGDRNDTSFDSAVFLSKFDIGNVNLGTDLTVNGNSALCAGQSYTINSGLTAPPYGFTWYYQAPSTSTFVEMVGETAPTLNVTLPGEYKLVAQYIGSACVGEDTIVVEFYPDLVLITPEPNDLSICSTNPAVFDLTQNTPVVTANFATPSDYQVTYYLTQADAIAGINAISNPSTYTNVTNPQTIWVRIYSTVTFCAGIKNFEIEVVSPPSADITYTGSPYCFNDGAANVTITGSTGGTYSIVGSPLNISVNSTGTVTWNNQITPGTYTINYAIGSGACSSSDSTTLTIGSPITASFTSGNTTICDGNTTAIAITGTPGATITYNDGSSNQTVVLDVSGNGTINHSGGTKTYTLVSMNLGSCTLTLSGTVIITVNSFDFDITGKCDGSQFVLTANVSNPQNYSFEWTNDSNIVVGSNPTLPINEPGTYTCTVTNLSGFVCSTEVSELFDNIFCQIQKGISPNSDGLNDYLELVANKVEIFNRYGKEVYTKTNYNNDWRGQFNGGGEMPDGTYYYVIELVSGEKKTGWIYINREQ
ncbi:MAG: choice-of-anchor L domain-containing protein [Bacteroidota bacterium]